jgi:hypothetical protein
MQEVIIAATKAAEDKIRYIRATRISDAGYRYWNDEGMMIYRRSPEGRLEYHLTQGWGASTCVSNSPEVWGWKEITKARAFKLIAENGL